MIITIASFKGGVGKTTSAIHLAYYLAELSNPDEVLLVDGDPNRSCLGWADRGTIPFKVCDLLAAAKHSNGKTHTVIDTQANLQADMLKTLSDGCDLLLLPTTADALSLEALLATVSQIDKSVKVAVAVVKVDPRTIPTAKKAQAMLRGQGLHVCDRLVRQYAAFQYAALKGVPVQNSAQSHARTGWGDYQELGKELMSYAEK